MAKKTEIDEIKALLMDHGLSREEARTWIRTLRQEGVLLDLRRLQTM